MAKDKFPTTQAIRVLKEHRVDFILQPYKYVEKGGTATFAGEKNVDEHLVIKTLVMEDEKGEPFIILMHGDREVSTKGLARTLGVKSVRPCDPRAANRHTGYVVGGTSPFGTRRPLKVYVESTILSLPGIYINAGKRGLLAEIAPADLVRVLKPIPVEVAV
jgi:Cys-tRNA(Pro) deacylase